MICVNITVLNDNALEGNETFGVNLTAMDSNVIIGTAATAITIIDNDSWYCCLLIIV